MAKATRESDPLVGWQFVLEINKLPVGYFSECSGIGSETEIIEHKTLDKNGVEVVQKIPGRLKWSDVTLKRGITNSLAVYQWRTLVELGKMKEARLNCTIKMKDRDYSDAAEWTFDNAWPQKVSGPDLKSDSMDIGIEEMVLVHEGMRRTK